MYQKIDVNFINRPILNLFLKDFNKVDALKVLSRKLPYFLDSCCIEQECHREYTLDFGSII